MSATDELRRMLDERGVEYTTDDGKFARVTRWCASNGRLAIYAEYSSGELRFAMDSLSLTPEQAIAATLGETYTREDVESAFVSGYSLGTLPVGSDPQWDENRQTVDEHMAELGWVRAATLGRGECEIETKKNWLPAEQYHRCKHCGAFFAVMDASGDIPPCVCPNCGKAVKR